MKILITILAIIISINANAFESKMTFTVAELNKNERIARNREKAIAAGRIIELQLQETGCNQPRANSPDMYEEREKYTFDIESDNCIIISNTSKCENGFLPRNLKPNPNARTQVIVGADKYIVCLKNSADLSDSSKQMRGK